MATNKHKDDDMILKPDLSIMLRNKASLRRSEETGIPMEDEKVIAVLEGDIDSIKVDADLATAFASTKAHPDKAIVYPDPASLKKRVVLIPVTARYAAAAVILILISIGTWFMLNPAASPDREQFVLTSLDSKPVIFEKTSSDHIKFNGSDNSYSMIRAREELTLYKTEGKSPAQLQVQYSLSISDQMSDISPSNIQHLTPNTLGYAQIEPTKRSLLGKVFSGMFNRVKAPFERNEAQAKPGPEKGFSIWDIAELGVKGVNTLGDHEYTMVRNYNKKGKVKGITILDE